MNYEVVAVLGVKYLRFFICLVLIYLGSRGIFHEEDIWHEFEGGGGIHLRKV